MTIWALKGPSQQDYDEVEYKEVIEFLRDSIKSGVSRFGWGYMDSSNLTQLRDKAWAQMDDDERKCWSKAGFLLEIKPGDWLVHINVPYWGACFAVQVKSVYEFEKEDNDVSDYRHIIKTDLSTLVEFERNDDEVLPIISSRLKLQGRYWRIQHEQEFMQTITNIRDGISDKSELESVGIFYLKRDISPILSELTNKIQKTHPAGKLEELIANVFRKIPNVVDVVENGKVKGWATDHGADLIVTYKSGLSISNLEKEEKLVVQVKSFTGFHFETNAVNQIKDAISQFNADAGMIITTAEKTEELEKAIELLSSELSKPIGLISGENVARFLFRYGGEMIL